MLKRTSFLLTVVLLLAVAVGVNAQVTTSSMAGKVTDSANEPIIGATVQAVHEPSGSRYGAITNVDGRYTIQGMRAGGPYKVTVSYVGYQTSEAKGITLQLGETFRHNVEMSESSELLGEVVITGKSGVDATKTGAAMHVSASEINRMPSINHGIADVTRLNPQVRVTNGGAMYFAGTNNRYNSFQIDGAMNNDVFGLTANGSNGGQAGTQPVSMETIEQIQVNVAPFDVRQSGFTGGSINAITKSGTNDFHGTIYGFGNNQHLIGSKYRMMNGKTSDKYMDQDEYNAGITFGGPIIKNKLFFFANYEKANQTYQSPYSMGATASKVDAAEATAILKKLQEMAAAQGVAYNGNLDGSDVYTKSDKGGLKLDWNINDKHKASFRWSLVSAKQLNSASGASALNASDYSYDFVSKTNSFVAELQSRFNETISNEFRASYVRVRDERQPGAAFPMISISNVGSGTLNLGNERSSMANALNQDIYTITDNLNWYTGNHTFTFGTHNELYSFSNLFIQDTYGTYYFGSPADFYNGVIKQYRYGQANTSVTGDPRWAPSFSAGQVGLYAQDKMNVTDNLDVTLGVRMDVPLFFDTPTENAEFNTYAASKGWGYKTNSKLSSSPMFSPRAGFRWDINGNNKYILRGGVGIFTGRIPFVWLSNNFSNTGIQLSTYNVSVSTSNPNATKDLSVILDPSKQSQNADKLKASGSQTINVFDKDFRFAQNLRANLAFDFELGGINWTAEAIYSKTLNDILYQNLAYDLNGKTLSDVVSGMDFDKRPMLSKLSDASAYNGIYALSNTSKGYTYNLSLKAEKKFDFGLDLMASYAFTKSKTVNNGTSSVAQSNWQYNYTIGNPNAPELANSAFNVPHSIRVAAFYTKKWKANRSTTVGLIYTGTSGMPYSVYYNGDLNGDSGYNDLFFIPTDAQIEKMPFADYVKDGKVVTSAADQKANFKAWLANDEYMKDHRGEYFERNAANEKFEHHFDFHLAHTINFMVGKNKRALEFSLDIMNIGNLFNEKWGHTSASNGYYSPVVYGYDKNTKSNYFQFLQKGDYNMRSYSDYYSRWRGQVGVKFTF
ncbi:TonB-dependent receptor [Bacteroides helcogenes]|uniref:TonB-dependent receptor plug n=1 Tax=Bacteroides helcogenes (strain ATCC 35417 / DSM 20613 / JCM 6297 / CCUG 15421 / P 36-108) TaxID=693979 RepID=E6SWD2_BACT6|nr:TonB-dependent receptor [Bacteroides helcogenes]ADV44593.1 TonB-dependent receptor plug [Bacteroides helcogenes P 36-108]MDY5238882.1 TonB-dependent receptor [Bacteroides helcogenes]